MAKKRDPREQSEWLRKLPSYRLAFEDIDFLHRDELRPVRLMLELLKPELLMQEEGVRSTIVVYGSARVPSPEDAEDFLREAEAAVETDPDCATAERELARARRRVERLHYYQEARRFGELVSNECRELGHENEFVITTGGGPGIMEAANRGAHEAGSKSIGLNIDIPFEQTPNPFISPELCFFFHYFALRKMHFLLRARALVAFPGGFGTLDELFDALTLIQTRKIDPMPVVMVCEEYWRQVVDFDFLVEQGSIGEEDRALVTYVESAEEAWEVLRDAYPEALGER